MEKKQVLLIKYACVQKCIESVRNAANFVASSCQKRGLHETRTKALEIAARKIENDEQLRVASRELRLLSASSDVESWHVASVCRNEEIERDLDALIARGGTVTPAKIYSRVSADISLQNPETQDIVEIGRPTVEIHIPSLHIKVLPDRASYDGFAHPNVSRGGDPCLGNMLPVINMATFSGDFLSTFDLMEVFLKTYNPDDRYRTLASWNGIRCHECHTGIRPGNQRQCGVCGIEMCGNCMRVCGVCNTVHCAEHYVERTTICGHGAGCNSCVITCPICKNGACHSCVRRVATEIVDGEGNRHATATVVCSAHTSPCNSCGTHILDPRKVKDFPTRSRIIDGNLYCTPCVRSCVACSKEFVYSSSFQMSCGCRDCVLCEEHALKCVDCGGTVCTKAIPCRKCKKSVCQDCMVSRQCGSCSR